MNEARRGSRKWIQIAVNQPAVLNSIITDQLHMCGDETIDWRSPLVSEGYKEYWDQAFVNKVGIETATRPLSDFWPQGGPHWDALATTSTGRILLVEAKAHIRELVSPPSSATGPSLEWIRRSLQEVQQYLGVHRAVDWSGWFYQYTNRLAYLYWLRELNQLPAELLFVYFVNDHDMGGPTSSDQWEGAIKLLETYLGLPQHHRLSSYVHHLYVDVQSLQLGEVVPAQDRTQNNT